MAAYRGRSTWSSDVQMSRSPTLRDELRRRFFPLVEADGFVRDDSHSPRAYVFRRFGPEKVDLLMIGWDKYLRPMFHVRFNDAPTGGVMIRGEHFAAARLWPHDPSFPLELCRRPGPTRRSWFRVRKPLLERLLTWKAEWAPSEVIDLLISLYPEMSAWWKSGAVGSHLWAPLGTEGGFRLSLRASD